MSAAVEIRGSGDSWAVFHSGHQVGLSQTHCDKACAAANVLERRLNERPRACLCCGASFISSGFGHRLCTTCRAKG
ncbi:hypothetical protein SAMN05877831_107163 [Rhodobacter maris]|uniref:Uncharacterized protein n=1 Tax=Rhodobacter maris TaxID=446682 RepID=A0A285SQ06_9RHOB|nr:hypothetical protein SAMN05877831_107163 [Rhodobacter maris]